MTDLFEYQPPAKYPDTPGVKERNGTSQEAADKIAPDAKIIKAKILAALRRYGPMIADECAAVLGEKPGNVRPRLSEMKDRHVYKTAERRKNADGNSQVVWALV